MSNPANTTEQNLLPVQAYFDEQGDFQTFIGQGKPFYATVSPDQSGLHITDSTIDSTTIGATTPSTGVFTNIFSITGQVTTSPSAATDIANKAYVDAIAQGLAPKQACKVATTADITLSGLQTIDTTYTTVAGDRVLVKNQLNSAQNGIYIASAGPWSRSADMDVWSEVPGAYTVILNGSVNGSTSWVTTAADTGTIGVTSMPWVQFASVNTYYAGTGLSLLSNTFSITNTGVTAATYGSASKTLTLAVNAQGQITSASASDIAIAATQITSGTIDSARISGDYSGITGVGTLLNLTVTNTINGSINGNAATATTATTASTASKVANALTVNDSGTGSASGATFDGSSAVTISYNTIGAPKADGTGASGTWNINISGNAATATSSGSSTTASNLAGGTAGQIPYQTGANATSFTAVGSSGQVLSSTAGSAPTWISASGLLDNISSTQGVVLYRDSTAWAALATATAGYLLQTGGAGANPSWVNPATLSVSYAATAGSATTATTATNLAGGAAASIPYQSAAGTTTFLASGAGDAGKVLQSNGTSAPSWVTPTAYATVTDDTTTNGTRYPLFADVTTGNLTTEYVSSTKFQFNPSTGTLTSTVFSGSGASLTNLPAGQLSGTIPSGVLGNSTLYVGTTAITLNRSSASQTLTGTSIDGNAATATSATSATNTTNVAVTDDTSTNATYYVAVMSASTGNVGVKVSSTKLQYNPSTGALTATGGIGGGTF